MTACTPTLLIVWHSRTGAAHQMAKAVERGARAVAATFSEEENAAGGSVDGPVTLLEVRQCQAETVDAQLLRQAAGYVFCAPENLGTLSGAMKEFFDRNYYHVLDHLAGRPYAAIIAAGTDGHGARNQLERIATGWRLRPLTPTLVLRNGAQTPEEILAPKVVPEQDLARCEEIGGLVAGTLLL